jgi:site-specific recombinase
MNEPAAAPDWLEDFAPGLQRSASLRELADCLADLRRARALREHLDGWVALAAWVREADGSAPLPLQSALDDSIGPAHRRLQLLVELAERAPGVRSALARSLSEVETDSQALSLFAEAGLANDRGILQETSDRLARRLLPRPRDEHKIANVLQRLFPDAEDAEWIATVPRALFARLLSALSAAPAGPGSIAHSQRELVRAMHEALYLMSARIEALGLSEAMRERRGSSTVRDAAHYRLTRSTDALALRLERGENADEAWLAWQADAKACRSDGEDVRAHLEVAGVSVDLVYALDVIERLLGRMELLLGVLRAGGAPERAAAVQRLLAELVRARHQDRSLRSLARENLRLLGRKIIERAGRTGEHYITSTRAEYARMWSSGAGGGLITTATAAFKTAIAGAHFPLVVEGLLSGANYALSFVLIQLCGFTLATKQPSMTAAALAGILQRGPGPEREEALATYAARITRSQLAAAFANVAFVAIGAFLFDLWWWSSQGAPFVTPEKSDSILRSMHPFESGLALYAAQTGVVLWASSLIAGWVENFAVYHRLPQAIAEHRLGEWSWIGRARCEAAARWFARHVSGIGGSVALGFLLAFTPIVGRATGLPLDVRHVTLSTGQVALACLGSTHSIFSDPRVHAAIAGIAVTFVLNLSVSFFLALSVAARARNVPWEDRPRLLRGVLRRLVRRPAEFLLPPRSEDASAGAAHH